MGVSDLLSVFRPPLEVVEEGRISKNQTLTETKCKCFFVGAMIWMLMGCFG